MKLSRVDTNTLREATDQARAAMKNLELALKPLLVTDLTDQERKETLRAPVRLADAGRDTAVVARTRPTLMAAAEYDPEAVLEDLENHQLLAGLAEIFRDYHQWVEDSKLVWAGEAYYQTLRLYNVAKALEKTDGSLRPLVDPLEKMFQARRRRSGEGNGNGNGGSSSA